METLNRDDGPRSDSTGLPPMTTLETTVSDEEYERLAALADEHGLSI